MGDFKLSSEGIMVRKFVGLAVVLFAIEFSGNTAQAAKFAGLIGIMNTSGTVNVNNFREPKDVWTVYVANDPSEMGTILAYIAYKKTGTHQIEIVWSDSRGKQLDFCKFKPTVVNKAPLIDTMTCGWGGRLPTGGISFAVYDNYDGMREKIGNMWLPERD